MFGTPKQFLDGTDCIFRSDSAYVFVFPETYEFEFGSICKEGRVVKLTRKGVEDFKYHYNGDDVESEWSIIEEDNRSHYHESDRYEELTFTQVFASLLA